MTESSLLRTEDYWAICIGCFFLFFGLIVFFSDAPDDLSKTHRDLDDKMEVESNRSPFKTIEWHESFDEQKKLKASSRPIGKFLAKITGKPSSWRSNPIAGLIISTNQSLKTKNANESSYLEAVEGESKNKELASAAQNEAEDSGFKNDMLNQRAELAINSWLLSKDTLSRVEKKYNTRSSNKFPWLLSLAFVFVVLFGLGSQIMGTPFLAFAKGFFFVFFIGIIAYLLGAQADMKAIGFGYAAWAILIGLLVSNTIGTPSWVKPALSTEFYIKTGLVILGAEILLGKILAIGLPGIFVAWVVTPIVLVSTFWFGQRILKISSKTLNMTISADMSVCGVSAAVATAAACKASREELTVAIGLSMIFTSVMMILMPTFINYMGIPEVLGGAWLGGTIDATGAVVAAGAFLGEKALSVAATIKMIQNVLIGIIAFAVAIYFATKVEKNKNTSVGWSEIWLRFPKFILGFLGASVLFSAIYLGLGDNVAHTMIDQGVIGGFTKNVRGWLFCLAFVSIGLSINFRELKKHFIGGKPLILYLCGQAFNLCLTLFMAYVMFYLVFPHITETI